MAFTTQDIRDNYERRDTEELLQLARNDLTDIARTELNKVLAGRGVTSEVADQARAEAIVEQDDRLAFERSLAPFSLRLLAFVIDCVAVRIFLEICFDVLPQGVLTLLATSAALAYFLLRDAIPGQGLGKRLLALRTVKVETGKPARWTDSFWRNVTHIFFFIDLLFLLGTRQMRLGDMIAATVVVRSKTS